MTDSTTNKNTLRNSKQGQEAMPMPKDSGAMLICKVPVKTPMPCTVIVIHGVNDDGQFFPLVDQHICAGLNARLGRDDLFPHKWGTWKERSGVTVPTLESATVICEEGRSPVIPFHWGYRPVDRATYRQDQLRYKAQLDARNRSPDLPYSTYYREKQVAGQNSDNLGNWLSPAPVYAKDGGPYPNATTNLVDMWGPGPGGRVYEAGRFVQTDSAALMHDNPHRIYYVHAARRLADLILQIRRHPHAGPDTLNIIAHSQGTEIAMLANFMVVEAGYRPVDCLIMCHSPYGLYPTGAELAMPGRHQSKESRCTTLANFATLIQRTTKHSVPAEKIISRGVARKEAWEKPGHGRGNFGNVYNYFCPHDSVVSLPNVQGIGWQGVDEETLEALGTNFYQRVFSDGHVVGTGPGKFELGKKSELAGAGLLLLASELTRTINAPRLPATYTFHKQKNGPLTGNKLGEHLAGTALATEGLSVVERLVDKTTGAESPVPANLNRSVFAYDYYPAAAKAQLATTPYPYVEQIRASWTPPKVAGDAYSNCILVRRTETPEEALSRLGERPADWSQHSAITLHPETIEKCMAYDLAIGLTAAYDDEKLWWELIHRADWRSDQNRDKNATEYYSKGILPPDIKPQMSKPDLPKGIRNEFASPGKLQKQMALTPYGLVNEVVDWITTPAGGIGQWPLPKPDVKG